MALTRHCVTGSAIYRLETRKPGRKTWRTEVLSSNKAVLQKAAKVYRKDLGLVTRVVKTNGKKACVVRK